jgi:PhnB protein
MKLPENYQTVMPYLVLQNASAFISFSKTVFNAKESHKSMRAENIISHAEVIIGASTIMFADATDAIEVRPAGLFVYVENADETFNKAIAANATVVTELANQTYGRSGGVQDPFGNVWWITSAI